MMKDFRTNQSRLANFERSERQTGEIAGRKVSESEFERRRKPEYVKTSIKIPRELKEKSQVLASLKQMSWTALIERGLELQLKENADLMNQFSKYNESRGKEE